MVATLASWRFPRTSTESTSQGSMSPSTAHTLWLRTLHWLWKAVTNSDHAAGSEVAALHQTSKLSFVGATMKVRCSWAVTRGTSYSLHWGWASHCGWHKSYLLLTENDEEERAYQDLVSSNIALDKNKKILGKIIMLSKQVKSWHQQRGETWIPSMENVEELILFFTFLPCQQALPRHRQSANLDPAWPVV